MNLVTGKKSNAHVSSDDFRKIVESLVGGGGSFVSSVGTELQTSVSGTTLSIGKGMIVHHGCVFETSNSGDTVNFQAGSSGMNRIDLICVKYTRNNTTGIEDAAWNVLQGTATSGTPVQPTVPSGDLRDDNATQDYCPVFKLTLTGNTPTVQLLLNTIPIDDAYHKPSTGIPSSDMASAVQTSLGLANSACQIDLLWTNSSPLSAYPPASPTISTLNNYDYIMVQYQRNTGMSTIMCGSTIIKNTVNEYGDMIGFAGVNYGEGTRVFATARSFKINASSISFLAGVGSNSSTDNTVCIPYKVWGIKGGN